MIGRTLFRTPPLDVAVEIGSRQVIAVQLTGRSGAFRVAAYAEEPLPEGTVVPSLTATNFTRPAAVAEAVVRAFARLGTKPRRVGLIVPDPVARVSLVRFAKVPARAADLDEMVRFQVRKATPFKAEEALISYGAGAAGEGGQEYVVVQARRDIIQEYEAACHAAGAATGLVDLATFNVIKAAMAAGTRPADDWLLVHVAADYAAIAIMRGQDLIFFRNRGGDGDEGQLSELVHQTAMYYQDRLGGAGFARVLLAGAGEADDADVRRSIESRLGLPVETVDPTTGAPLPDRVSPSRALVHALTPALGMALAQRATR